MLFIILFTVAFLQVSFISTQESICDKNPYKSCRIESRSKFPESEEDVEDLCKDLVPFHHCVSEFLSNCEYDDDEVPNQGIFKSGIIIMACNKESQLYEIIVDNVKCMGDAIKDLEEERFCGSHLALVEEETPDLEEKVLELITGDTPEEKQKLEACLDTVFEVGCIATAFSKKCGSDALNLFLFWVEKSRMTKDACAEEHQNAIENYVKLMKFELDYDE